MAEERPRTKSELKRLFTNLRRKLITDSMMSILIESLWRNIVQSDWAQDDPYQPDYIKNKPDITGGGGSSVITPFTEIPAGDKDGVNLIFYLSEEPISTAHVRHFLNGNRLVKNVHYFGYIDHFEIIPSDFMPIPSGTDTLVSEYYIYISGTRPKYGEIPAGAIDGVNTQYQLSEIPVSHSLFLNGNRLVENVHYTRTDDIFEIIPSDFMPIPSGTDTLICDFHY